MKNLIEKCIEATDNFVLKKANDLNRAWNWTTGRTRADLAKCILLAGTGSTFIGAYSVNPSLVMLPLPLAAANIIISKTYDEIDSLEIEAAEKGCKNIRVERFKGTAKKLGYSTWAYSTMAAPSAMYDNGLGCAGIFTCGSSAHIMRTDYLPPQKNCISRGLDKLSEIANSYRKQSLLGI